MTFAIWRAEQDVRLGEATNSYADRPSITHLPNGGYVVAWRESNQLKFKVYNGGGDSNGTVYSVHGGAGNENNIQIQAIGTDGRFAVSWNAANNNTYDLKTRVFTLNADGVYIGGAVNQIHNGPNASSAELATLTSTMDGGLASTYVVGNDVYLAMHDANGARIGNGYRIHVGTSDIVDYPDVTQIAADKFVVSFGQGDFIRFKIVTIANGTATPHTVLGTSTLQGERSEVVALKDGNGEPDGRFAVVQSRGALIVAKFYDQAGNRIGDVQNELVLTNDAWAAGDHFNVTAIRGGRIAVVYSGDAAIQGNIVLKVTDTNGKGADGTSGPDTRVIDATDNQDTPTVTEMKDGRLAIAWADPTRGQTDVSSVIFDPRLDEVYVRGTAGNDYYVGTEYDGDVFEGGAGADYLDGGAGFDYVSYEGAGARVVANLENPALNNTTDKHDATGDTYANVEGLIGSAWHDVLTGNGVANIVYGNDGSDILSGRAGNDTLYGGSVINEGLDVENDYLDGGAGDDSLSSGAHDDTLSGGAGGDILKGGSGYDIASYENAAGLIILDLGTAANNRGDAAGDTFDGIEAYVGSAFGDRMTGKAGAENTFYGGKGNDTLVGAGAVDRLFGQGDDDVLMGGADADVLDGGEGFDYASYENAQAGVRASLAPVENFAPPPEINDATGDDYTSIEGLIGSAHYDILSGHSAGDVLIGGAGRDFLSGAGGHDTLDGGIGADEMEGGDGVDFASYASAALGVVADLNNRTPATDFAPLASLAGTNDAAGDTYLGIEGLIGSAHADRLIATADGNTLRGEGGDDVLEGSFGNDTLEGGSGNDRLVGGAGVNVLKGGLGDDTYVSDGADVIDETGGGGNDTVYTSAASIDLATMAGIENVQSTSTGAVGLTGNALANTLYGNAGNDSLNGKEGNDTLYGGAGSDTLYGEGGDDMLHGQDGTDVLYGKDGNDTIYGGASADTLHGESGNDVLYGQEGADLLYGGTGNDTYHLDTLGDQVFEGVGGGIDRVYSAASINLGSQEIEFVHVAGAASVTGSNTANTVYGGAGANLLLGNGGNDVLYGFGGADRIKGGAGNDILFGGSGRERDVFVFDTALNKRTNVDEIKDFNVKDDSIWLENKIFKALGKKGSETKPVKIGSDAFTLGSKAQDAEDRILYDKKSGALYYDKDGVGGAAEVKIATLTKNLKMAYHDFFVI